MSEENAAAILATYSAMNVAVKILADILVDKGIATRAEIAGRFRTTAANLPENAASRDEIARILNRTADGIGDMPSEQGDEPSPGGSIQ
jgi:hypothetical protein